MTRPDVGPRNGGRLSDDPQLHRLDATAQRQAAGGGSVEPRSTAAAVPARSGDGPATPTFDTGTTIVAVAATDGVAMAADQRMSLGGRFTANKNVRKVEQVHPTAAMAISGSVGPAQGLLQSLRAETSLYESRRGEPMSMTALSQTAGHLVRGLPVAPILAGVDDTGGHVFELDGSGSVLEDDYTAGGSGMQVAYGVLERRVEAEGRGRAEGRGGSDGESERSVEAATAAATAAVAAASERDTASGDGITVATITAEGVVVDDLADGEQSGAASSSTEEVA